MIEVTVIRGDGTPFAFQFENDALQAFLTQEAAEGVVCKVTNIMALGVPIVAKIANPAAKTAGPGAPRESGTLRTPTAVKPAQLDPAKQPQPEKK